ncbi:Phage-related protein, tail component [Phaeobacter inhibens]|nr:Phage-related protein, tail component [Phaeobacter inhibens]AUQ82761.1 Phage-related protein, tail component [Phaeobacter inhibens]AUQ90522.1 Phage-related protein, tail component [Phaeobacter inhibens]
MHGGEVPPVRKVHLHGKLAKYGKYLEMDILTAGEAIPALTANFPEFLSDSKQGSWVFMRGDPDTGLCLDEDAIAGMRLGNADLHIMPDVAGAKNGNGVLKAIAGATLIALTAGGAAPFLANPIIASAATGTTWGNAIGQIGLAMTLTGVSSMLAGETQSRASEDHKSFTLTCPKSEIGQGHAVQIVYGGPIIVGGMMISGGIDADGLESVTEKPVVTPDPEEVEANPENYGGGGASDR